MNESKTNDIAIITADAIRNKIYIVRGQQVMLDFELAEIYGYTTTRFNEQVKNNANKFDEDFRFQLTRDEWENLMSKKSTSSWGGRRKLPYAFTEQGIYMLMTVLRGELATMQSKALIRLFKQMKDSLADAGALSVHAVIAPMAVQASENARAIGKLREDLIETQDALSEFMAGFGKGSFGREYVIHEGQVMEAGSAYQEIYGLARKTVFVIDNYIGLKTLLHLKSVPEDVEVTIFSENAGRGLSQAELDDFRAQYPAVNVALKKTGGTFHDRFIILDYGLKSERVYICGSSSKDAGKRATVIVESECPEIYRGLVDPLLTLPDLALA